MLVAALGRAQLDRPAASPREGFGQHRPLGQLSLDDEQGRDRGGAAVVLQQELLGHLPHSALGLVGEIKGVAVGENAVAHLEDLGVGVAAVDGHGDGVERADRALGDALALHQRAHGAQPVALERGLLVVLSARGRAHALLEVALDRAEAPGEEVDHAVDAAAVVLLGDVADAGSLAALDVVVQARAAAAPSRLGARAGAVHEHLGEHLERRAHTLGARVGAEVGATRAVALTREVHPGDSPRRARSRRTGRTCRRAGGC